MHSYLEAANIFEFNLTVAVPSTYKPAPEWVEKANGRATFVDSPEEAVKGAQVITTDVWTSMGQENEIEDRLRAFSGYQITPALSIRGKRCLLPSLFTCPQRRRDL